MIQISSRWLNALCLAATVLLSACGSGTTTDPFKPNRVIALGDGYNVATSTITGTTDAAVTVAEQVALLFGIPVADVLNYAEADALIKDPVTRHADLAASASLETQIQAAITAAGGAFTDKDLIIISIGTRDIISGVASATAADDLRELVNQLLQAKATHVLLMQPLELTRTPYVRDNSTREATYLGKTEEFIEAVKTSISEMVSQAGYHDNPVIYGGQLLSSNFNIYTSNTKYLEFSTSTRIPACTAALTADVLTGCALADANASYAKMLFADDINLTPAGNRWVARHMYNATAYGWR